VPHDYSALSDQTRRTIKAMLQQGLGWEDIYVKLELREKMSYDQFKQFITNRNKRYS
jgi:hypothetical protein